MGYYVGDFYQGDFMGMMRRGVSLARRGVTALYKYGSRSGTTGAPAAAGVASTGSIVERIAGGVRQEVMKHPVLSAAAAAGIGGAIVRMEGHPGAAIMHPGAAVAGGMRGYHISKRGKHAGQLVRNRRMRVTNPKALRRALRRAHGFAKLAMRTIHLVHPRKKGRFGGFRRKRHARV